MVDFTRETPIGVMALASRLSVNQITIRRWFARGLEFTKLGGKVYTSLEAVNRFQSGSNDGQRTVQAIVVDKETLAAIKSLKAQGFKIGSGEGSRDGRVKAKAQA